MTYIDDLLPLATSTVTATRGTTDGRGKFTSSSTTNLTKCRITGKTIRTIDSNGNDIRSKYKVISLEDAGLWHGKNSSNEEWRFTLPVSNYPNVESLLIPISVERIADEDNIAYEKIML